MDPEMDRALIKYGTTIKAQGWEAGEPLIRQGMQKWPEFRQWAHALGIMLRAKEILKSRND